MANLVRKADVEKEKTSLTAFLSRYLSARADDARYEWLYCKNPGGKAQAWIAFDSESTQVIGVAAAFPRQIQCHGTEVLGYVLGDFCIHPEYRSLGPALALQRQCLEELFKGDAGPIFDFPSTSMLAIYKRLRIESSETMVRFAKPLRVDRLVNQRISSKMAARGVAAIANFGLRLRDASFKRTKPWIIAEEVLPCREEFTCATRQWSNSSAICVIRTADYLNWRYLQHPQRRYHLWTARRDGKLCGFLVYHLAGEDAAVVDLLGEENAVIKALLAETVLNMRHHGVSTLSVPFLSSHPGRALLETCGFRPREASPVILLTASGNSDSSGDGMANPWYLTHGDRES